MHKYFTPTDTVLLLDMTKENQACITVVEITAESIKPLIRVVILLRSVMISGLNSSNSELNNDLEYLSSS